MTAPRKHAELAARYFADDTTKCWARFKNGDTEALSRDEWSRRYAARIAAVAGWDQASADAAAEALPDEYMGDYASPEEAADDEMSNWEDDGDE